MTNTNVVQLSAVRRGDQRRYHQSSSQRSNKQREAIAAAGFAPVKGTPEAARRAQRLRLKVAKYEPNDDVEALVGDYLKKGGKITRLEPGAAFGTGKLDWLHLGPA